MAENNDIEGCAEFLELVDSSYNEKTAQKWWVSGLAVDGKDNGVITVSTDNHTKHYHLLRNEWRNLLSCARAIWRDVDSIAIILR